MTISIQRRVASGWIFLLLLVTAEVQPPAAAQSTVLPYATVHAVPQTFGEVWPGDFNEDGITDLASGADDLNDPINGDAPIRITLGNGDGTFRAPIVSSTVGWVRAVADLNRDGFLDVLAGAADGLVVLRGNGNGTLGAPRAVTSDGGFGGFVLASDLNADGNRDVVQVQFADGRPHLGIFAGRGDLTFEEPVLLPVAPLPTQATIGDFDADGRPDIALTHLSPAQVSIYMNEGLLQFTSTTLPVPKAATDLTARDVNGDRLADLLVSGSTHPGQSYANDGFLYVLAGGGNGTFRLTGTYPTAIGPVSIVVGDFTRDGRLDVATANRSARIIEDGCALVRDADSVSILPGAGDGTFGPPTTFALGSQQYGAEVFGLEVDSLNTSDLNRDGHPDLIVSDGRVLLAAAPRANRAPLVDAGPGESSPGGSTIFLRGGGVDPDGHLLSFRVTDASGRVDYRSNFGCIDVLAPERYELTMTASDGRLQASDTVLFDFSFHDPGPPGWTNGDVGSVAAPGSTVFNPQDNEFTVTGSGADIWNAADEFHFTHHAVTGDFTIYTRVWSVENVHRWTKAGLMIREGLSPGARHASLFVTPTSEKGIAFQRRHTAGGPSVHTAGPAATAPVWIMLKRTGDLISAYSQPSEGGGWTVIARDVLSNLAPTLQVGLAVSSHLDGRTATARFRDLLVLGPGVSGWTSSDIGAVGVAGTTELTSEGAFVQRASGADIWGTADSFRFQRAWWTSDGTLTVRVRSLDAPHHWAKLGLMFRETHDPASRHVMLVVSAARGVAMQYRAQPGGTSANVALSTGAAPEWLRLTRSGNTFTGHASEDGVTWRPIGAITVAMDTDTFAGVVLTSHDNTRLATGVFDALTLAR